MQATKTMLAVLAIALVGSASTKSCGAGPEDDRSYRAGIGLLNKGLSDLASSELRAYLAEHPDGPEATNARYSLAVCLSRLGRHAEADKELGRVLEVAEFEFAADAALLHAQCLIAAGDDASAVAALRSLAGAHPGFAQLDRAALLEGESLYRLGQFSQTREILGRIAVSWPKSAELERAGLFAAMAESALGDYAAGAARCARLREAFPHGEYNANAALLEGQCRQQLKDFPGAAKLFAAAGQAKGQLGAEALLSLAAVSRVQGDLEQARKSLGQAEKEGVPQALHDWFLMEKGKLLFQQKDGAASGAAFAEVRKSGSEQAKPEAALWFAKAQAMQGKYAEASANLEHAAELYPKSELLPDMLFERAAALSRSGDDVAALEAWETWRGRFPESELIGEATVAEAWCAHRLGQFEHCAQLCTLAKAAHGPPGDSESLELLGAENAFASQRMDDALSAYGTFLERFPKGQHAWRARARRVVCLTSLNRDDDAGIALRTLPPAPGGQDPSLRRAAVAGLADHLLVAGEWSKAEAWFSELAAEAGAGEERLDALLRQGICVERQTRFAEALPLFEAVLKEDYGSSQALQAQFERGQSLLELGRLDEAKTSFEAVTSAKQDPAHLATHAQRHLATIASRQGRHDEAAAILASLMDTANTSGLGASGLQLGSAYLAAGKYSEAESTFSKYLESNPGGVGVDRAKVLRSIALNRSGRHEDAIAQLTVALDVSSLDSETNANGRYELASALKEAGREEEAAAAYRIVLGTAPARLQAYAALDLAQLESRAKRFAKSLDLLDQCLTAAGALAAADPAPVREHATYLRGACLLQMDKPKEAEQSLQEFASTYPESTLLGAAQLVRGEALLALGRAREAAEVLSRAAAVHANDTAAAGLLRLGEAWAACQEWTRSEQSFTSFLDRFAESPMWFQAKFGQGWARENQGRQDAAIEAYREVVARHHGITGARAQFQIGECLYAQKKYEAAVAELLKTDVLFPYPEWSAAALYEAGRCLGEMNRPDDSARQFADLAKRFPDTRWAKLAAEKARSNMPAPIPGRGAALTSQPR